MALARLHRAEGFQLLELTFVVALLGMAAAVGYPQVSRALEMHRLEGALRTFVTHLSTARAQAIARNLTMEVATHPDRGHFSTRIQGEFGVWWELPRGVLLEAVPSQPIRFYSRGSAVPAGSYVLASNAGRRRVIVSPAGRVRWETLP